MDATQGPPSLPDRSAFTACVGSRFRVTAVPAGIAPGGLHDLELAEAKELPKREGGAAEPFVLLFRGAHDASLPQGTYPLEHATLGAHEIFIVPLGPDADGYRYEAIFT